jgi:hypothetical protein
MSGRKTDDDDERKSGVSEPRATAEVGTRLVVLDRARPAEKEPAPKGKIEPRVKPWSGPKSADRPPSIGSMQPPGK